MGSIHVFPSGKERKVRPALKFEGPKSACDHYNIRLMQEKREVYCRDCGSMLDPFEALQRIGRDWHWYAQNKARLRDEMRLVSDSLKELKRHETNAKARLKRIQNKLKENGE